jgi:hypothetical protein
MKRQIPTTKRQRSLKFHHPKRVVIKSISNESSSSAFAEATARQAPALLHCVEERENHLAVLEI